jgi:hypothetical protein
MAAMSSLDAGVGEALERGAGEAAAGEAVGAEEEVGDGELDGVEPPQAAITTRMAARRRAARRFIAGILARGARMAVS